MKQTSENSSRSDYALATGRAATSRLQMLHGLYGPGSCRVLQQAGIQWGMRVADLGCGAGLMTAMLAELVGPTGYAFGVDFSGAQLTQAREVLPSHLSNVTFVEASAIDTRLPKESLDLVYCRFLLLHLPEPERALREMHRILKPGGILVCEDSDLTSGGSEPPSSMNAFGDLWGRLGPFRGVDYTMARQLIPLILAAGFSGHDLTFNQPVVVRGESKRFLEWSVAEAGPAFVGAGLITSEELEQTLTDMQRVARDETVVAIMPRMSQVWARKS